MNKKLGLAGLVLAATIGAGCATAPVRVWSEKILNKPLGENTYQADKVITKILVKNKWIECNTFERQEGSYKTIKVTKYWGGTIHMRAGKSVNGKTEVYEVHDNISKRGEFQIYDSQNFPSEKKDKYEILFSRYAGMFNDDCTAKK